MRDAESILEQVLSYADGRLTEADVRAAVGLADDEAIAALVDAYQAGDVAAALGRVADLADAGRDLGQVAAQAEAEARGRLLASAADPVAARRLAAILRAIAEAAGSGAREGRSRLQLELLAVEPLASSPCGNAEAPQPRVARTAGRVRRGSAEGVSRARTGSRARAGTRRRGSPRRGGTDRAKHRHRRSASRPSGRRGRAARALGRGRRAREPRHQAAPQGVPAHRPRRRRG